MSARALLALVAAACATAPAPKAPERPRDGRITVIAHRGGALEAPENTLAAVRHAAASGAGWVEIDVLLAADDEVVVIHDDEVGRLAGAGGSVAGMTLAEIKRLRVGRPRWSAGGLRNLAAAGVDPVEFGDRFASEPVPTLAETLTVERIRFMVELKRCDRIDRLAARTVEVVRVSPAADRVALASFEIDLLRAARAHDASLPLIGILEDPALIEPMLALGPMALAVRKDLVETARAAAPPGVRVWAWTAYRPDEAASLAARGADGVITDVPAATVRAAAGAAVGPARDLP